MVVVTAVDVPIRPRNSEEVRIQDYIRNPWQSSEVRKGVAKIILVLLSF